MKTLPSIDFNGEDFVLVLPSGRTMSVPANAHGVEYLKKIITEGKRELMPHQEPRGYINAYPSQHIIDEWIKKDKARKEVESAERLKQEREEIEAKYNIDLKSLDFKL